MKCCKEIEKENYSCLRLDLGGFDGISSGKGKKGRFISHNGELLSAAKNERNPYSDTKTLDAVAHFKNVENGRSLRVYFFCKYTVGRGGAQDYIPREVKVTTDCINMNTENNLVVAFMLEGDYWTPSLIDLAPFDGKKTFYVNRDNMKRVLTSVLRAKDIL